MKTIEKKIEEFRRHSKNVNSEKNRIIKELRKKGLAKEVENFISEIEKKYRTLASDLMESVTSELKKSGSYKEAVKELKKELAIPIVVIDVLGGVAYVSEATQPVKVIIYDHDGDMSNIGIEEPEHVGRVPFRSDPDESNAIKSLMDETGN